MRYELSITDKQLICKLYVEHFKKEYEQIGKLVVDYKTEKVPCYYTINGGETGFYSKEKVDLTISAWYVNEGYQNRGYGKEMLKKVFNSIDTDTINEIKYMWNGANQYVGYWLTRMNAVNDCPIQFLKNSEKDSWECHLYTLNKDTFLNYLEEDD